MKTNTIKADGIIFFDEEERELYESVNRGEWRELPKKELADLRKRHAKYAKAMIEKNKSITLRVNQWDIEKIKARAIAEGMPYQTLISSLLHKYVSGKLIEKQ